MDPEVRELLSRLHKVEEELGEENVLSDQKRYRTLSQEHSRLVQIKEAYEKCASLQKTIEGHRNLLKEEKDPELLALIQEELPGLEVQLTKATEKLDHLILPPDPRDDRSIILELRAGTGGDEAALFVGNCVRMYEAYATSKGWKIEPLSCAESERGGFKEYIFVLSGPLVFRLMQYEGGTHRVQRVPDTETQGRVHTSAVTVAILLEPDEEERVVVEEKDLRIDTFRASGAGGQHVNRTDSAVRLTHIPTGIVVACQEERSQHKNRDKAMRLLAAKIAEKRRNETQEAMASLRSKQVGSGDRSEKIRTYNFPQNRVTDHRIGLTLYSLNKVMDGDLDPLTMALVAHFYKERRRAAAGHVE